MRVGQGAHGGDVQDVALLVVEHLGLLHAAEPRKRDGQLILGGLQQSKYCR